MTARPAPEALDLLGVLAALRRACHAAGGQRAWAAAHGVSEQYVCDVLAARRDPGPAILRALGLVKAVRYVNARRRADR